MKRLSFTFFIIASAIFALVYIAIPFSFFVQIEKVDFQDICIGETQQAVVAYRTSWASFEGSSEDRMIFLDNGLRIETDIVRSSKTFVYERGSYRVAYVINWDEAPEIAGVYGVQSNVTIRPLFFWPVKAFFPTDDTFMVKDCSNNQAEAQSFSHRSK